MKQTKNRITVLAGDIGGTKTNLGLFTVGKRRPREKVIESFPSREASDLETIIERFLDKHPVSVQSACFGIAGPVVKGRSRTTNLPWEVSELGLKRRFVWMDVRLINDLAATAEAVPLLQRREFAALNKAKARKEQNLALVAPGTGLGEALLVFQDGEYIAISSEGGHTDFSPTNEAEIGLWRYLRERFGHVSVERVLSGPGLVNIYSWLRDSGRSREPVWLKRRFKEMDPARVITETALQQEHPLCVQSLNVFVSILGAAAGNLALTGMSTGGVYLGGGIPPRILPALKQDLFMKAFVDKGRFKGFMTKIPVRVILNDKAALLGAARCALRLLQ
ncbi:MAG: glucokinase [Desulfobacteraceae bacterium]|jgi:glucokinase